MSYASRSPTAACFRRLRWSERTNANQRSLPSALDRSSARRVRSSPLAARAQAPPSYFQCGRCNHAFRCICRGLVGACHRVENVVNLTIDHRGQCPTLIVRSGPSSASMAFLTSSPVRSPFDGWLDGDLSQDMSRSVMCHDTSFRLSCLNISLSKSPRQALLSRWEPGTKSLHLD
jgi:hypothetical protein